MSSKQQVHTMQTPQYNIGKQGKSRAGLRRTCYVQAVCVRNEFSFIEGWLIRGVVTGGERAWHCWTDEGVETSGTRVEAW